MTLFILPVLLWGSSAINSVWRPVRRATLPMLSGCIQSTSAYKTFYRESLLGQAYTLEAYKDEQAPANPEELTVSREVLWTGHAHGQAGSALHEGTWEGALGWDSACAPVPQPCVWLWRKGELFLTCTKEQRVLPAALDGDTDLELINAMSAVIEADINSYGKGGESRWV